MNEGWYQVRIAGSDMAPDTLTARLNESLPPGAVVHIVPRMAGAKNGIWQVVAGAALIGASFIPGLNAVAAAVLFSAGTSMALGGVAQMLTPVPKTPTVGQTDNGKQNTYFSSLENMVAQGNPVPVLYGEMKIGSRVICDNDYAGASVGGRITDLEISTRTLTLDREITLPESGAAMLNIVGPDGKPFSTEIQSQPAPDRVVMKVLPEAVQPYSIWGLKGGSRIGSRSKNI